MSYFKGLPCSKVKIHHTCIISWNASSFSVRALITRSRLLYTFSHRSIQSHFLHVVFCVAMEIIKPSFPPTHLQGLLCQIRFPSGTDFLFAGFSAPLHFSIQVSVHPVLIEQILKDNNSWKGEVPLLFFRGPCCSWPSAHPYTC